MQHRHGRMSRGRARRGRRGHIRRFLEPCLLLLHMDRSHGYDLAQELTPYGLGQIDPSLVYRMLRQMELRGLVTSRWDPDVVAGPARRVYRLTPEGDRHLADWVGDLQQADAFLHHFLRTYREHMEEGTGEYH
jgi:PadR family transcriptional regulator PadR